MPSLRDYDFKRLHTIVEVGLTNASQEDHTYFTQFLIEVERRFKNLLLNNRHYNFNSKVYAYVDKASIRSSSTGGVERIICDIRYGGNRIEKFSGPTAWTQPSEPQGPHTALCFKKHPGLGVIETQLNVHDSSNDTIHIRN